MDSDYWRVAPEWDARLHLTRPRDAMGGWTGRADCAAGLFVVLDWMGMHNIPQCGNTA